VNALALAIGLALGGGAPAKATYATPARTAHLEAVFGALKAAPAEVLVQAHQYVAVYERGACASPSQRLRVECLMTAARGFCKKRPKSEANGCALYLDVVVSNLMAQRQLIPAERRYEIMKVAHDWRREMARQLRRMQGALAADFELRMGEAPDDAALAKNVDEFCGATADETHLSWQICAASLGWFIVARAPDVEPRKAE
jgi:hypothetical protein